MSKSSELTQSILKEILDYDSETGIFKHKDYKYRKNRIGSVAGCTASDGRVRIGVIGRSYKAHRLAWLWVYGYLPENEIDHKNRNPSDNRISNLRETSHPCNLRNTSNRTNNTSGVKGVHLWSVNGKWQAYITVHGKRYGCGYFTDFDEAVCHRLAAEQCLNWSGCDSSSPAFQHVQTMFGR